MGTIRGLEDVMEWFGEITFYHVRAESKARRVRVRHPPRPRVRDTLESLVDDGSVAADDDLAIEPMDPGGSPRSTPARHGPCRFRRLADHETLDCRFGVGDRRVGRRSSFVIRENRPRSGRDQTGSSTVRHRGQPRVFISARQDGCSLRPPGYLRLGRVGLLQQRQKRTPPPRSRVSR